MTKNKVIKEFMEKKSIKSDDMATFLNITRGIMANILRGSRKVHRDEWENYLKAKEIIKKKGKNHFEKLCTKKAKYLFPLEIKIPNVSNNWMDLDKVKSQLKKRKQTLWDISKIIFIREKGKDFIKINLKDESLFSLLGWILTEGHIPKSDRCIQIHQKDKTILNKIKRNIDHIIKTSNINKGHEASCLNIISAPLRFLYLDYFNVKPGHQKETIKIPKAIIKTNQENKCAFLAGLEGDMHFSITKRKEDPFLRPSIGLSSKNKEFILQFKTLLRNFGIYASAYQKRNRNSEMQVSIIGKIRSTAKYFYYVAPYLISSTNYIRLSNILSQKKILNSIKIYKKECNNLKDLLIEARNKISNKTLKENYKLLAKRLKKEYNLKVKERTIEAWLFKDTGIPLSFIISSSKLTSTPFIKVLPNWISGVLYLHNYIPKESLEAIRKIKFPSTPQISQASQVLPSWIYSSDQSS